MTIDKLNTIDELNAIIYKLSKIIQYRKKIYSDERKQGQVKNYLKEIQSKTETLRSDLIGGFDYYKAVSILFQIKYIKRILKVFEDNDETALLSINAENPNSDICEQLDPYPELKEKILDVMREEVKRLNVELEKL